MTDSIIEKVREELTKNKTLRVGINASNFLLVSGINSDGSPFGIAPDLGRLFAHELEVTPKFIVFENPGKLADAGLEGAWDIAFVGNEPQRAKDIAFSAPYLEIPVTFLVREDSLIKDLSEIDQVGNRISVMNRSAYDLYLTAKIKHATIVRAKSIDESFEQFIHDDLEVLGGLKPRLESDCEKLPGSRVLDGQITSIKQSAGTLPAHEESANYLHEFIERTKATGVVSNLIKKYNVNGVSVAPPA